MTIRKRIRDLLLSLLQLICVALLLLDPVSGKITVTGIFQTLLVCMGIRYLIFYFTMARHMVDGRTILYLGGITLDLGIFLGFTYVLPSTWIMLYLIGYFLLRGIYRCLKVRDTRRVEDGKWIRIAVAAGWYLLLSLLGIANLRSQTAMVYLFSVEMTISALNRLAGMMKKTAIVYIQ